MSISQVISPFDKDDDRMFAGLLEWVFGKQNTERFFFKCLYIGLGDYFLQLPNSCNTT